ncbi:MAG: Ldh family oxidoreductase [Spirochaetaceae bacterium]
MSTVRMQDLIDFGRSYFLARGFSDSAAESIAEIAVLTQAFGITTHGLSQWGYIRRAIDADRIDPGAEPDLLGDRGAVGHLTGARVPGQVVMRMAVEMATSKAREHGISMIAVKKSHWVGAVGPYLIPIAENGLLAQAWAQSSACEDCAPVGGIDATFSTNPVALAIPTGGTPIIADFSTATVSMGKVKSLISAGSKADAEIFMDADGALTDDPRVVPEGGSILFTGGPHFGHKGYALSLWCEALTAVAGGDCNNPELPQSQSFNLTVIDPQAFGGQERYQAEIGRLVRRIRGVRHLPDVAAIRLPGDRGFASLGEARAKGVALDAPLRENLDTMATEAGISRLP